MVRYAVSTGKLLRCHSTRHNFAEDLNLQKHCCENLKSLSVGIYSKLKCSCTQTKDTALQSCSITKQSDIVTAIWFKSYYKFYFKQNKIGITLTTSYKPTDSQHLQSACLSIQLQLRFHSACDSPFQTSRYCRTRLHFTLNVFCTMCTNVSMTEKDGFIGPYI